jgi:glycosyltransferase involved in cell wall biosynthesis
MRIATFTFRSIPQRAGCAGVDKVSVELYTRLAARGHQIQAYNRLFKGEEPIGTEYQGVKTKNLYTLTKRKGFDSIIHSLRVCWDIIAHDTADLVHIHNTGNSPFGLVLRLFGKKVVLSQDGVDWQRGKWPWYGRLYLWLTVFLTAYAPHRIVFDSVPYKADFERRFRRKYDFVPWGSEICESELSTEILDELGLRPGGYFLFVGRFIPDKGLHYLIPAFERLKTDKKLVLVGGAPNPAKYEHDIMSTGDSRIIFPGFVFGSRNFSLMRHAYAYVQPSDIEGLSPVILENMGLGTPIICSDIPENRFAVQDTALLFGRGDIDDLHEKLQWALDHPEDMKRNGLRGRERARREFNWDRCADGYERIFLELLEGVKTEPGPVHDASVQSQSSTAVPSSIRPYAPSQLQRRRIPRA